MTLTDCKMGESEIVEPTSNCTISRLPEMEPAERRSWDIARELNELCYEQYGDGANTRLAKATREYMHALQVAALDYGEVYADLWPHHFMLSYHDNLSCDLHAV
jgi:hypothetical protein